MENKEVIISVVIIVVLLGVGVYLTQKTDWFESNYNYSDFEDFGDGDFVDFPMECYNNNDCVKVQTSCCPCSSGGEEICVQQSSSKTYIDKLNECKPKEMFCAQVYNCKINSCSCINGQCASK